MPSKPKDDSKSWSGYRRSASPLPGDPLEQARKYSAEQRATARRARDQLADAHDPDEEVTKTDHGAVHVHLHSVHDMDIPAAVKLESERKPVQWVKIVVGAAVTAILAWISTRFGVQSDHR